MKLIYLPSYLLAILWTFFWGNWRWLTKFPTPQTRKFAFMWGRRESPEPIKCECGWAGPVRFLTHGYCDDGMGDVEPQDFCPRCGSEL